MPYSSARPSDIPPDLPNNESIEDAFADTPEFAAAPNNDDDSTPESNEMHAGCIALADAWGFVRRRCACFV